jgi:hypothetical protein
MFKLIWKYLILKCYLNCVGMMSMTIELSMLTQTPHVAMYIDDRATISTSVLAARRAAPTTLDVNEKITGNTQHLS